MQCYEFPPLGGGGSRAVHGLSRALVRAGHEVDLVTMAYHGLPRREAVDGVQVHRAPCLRARMYVCYPWEMLSYLMAALPVSLKLARDRHYAINHTHFVFPDALLSWVLKRFTGLPYVITAHGSDVPGYNPDRFIAAHRFLAPLWRRVVEDTSHVILPSLALEKLFVKHSRKGHSRIPYGMDAERFRWTGLRRPRILVVTRMFERKGVQYLLEALAGWRTDHEVHIVGDGPYLDPLRRLALEYGVKASFWGWLDNDSPELLELYRTSRIAVLASEAENFPVVILEAMAAGLAVITTKETGCQEVVGDAALLVQSRSSREIRAALDRLVREPGLCEKLGREARRRVEREFSWDALARRHLEVYAAHQRRL